MKLFLRPRDPILCRVGKDMSGFILPSLGISFQVPVLFDGHPRPLFCVPLVLAYGWNQEETGCRKTAAVWGWKYAWDGRPWFSCYKFEDFLSSYHLSIHPVRPASVTIGTRAFSSSFPLTKPKHFSIIRPLHPLTQTKMMLSSVFFAVPSLFGGAVLAINCHAAASDLLSFLSAYVPWKSKRDDPVF